MKIQHQHRQNDAARYHEHDAIEVRPWIRGVPEDTPKKETQKGGD